MSLQLEMISCGDCSRCLAGGKVHGPYWYRYYRSGGTMVSEYVGKEIGADDADPQHPVGAAPEDLYPQRVEQMQTEAERDAEAKQAALSRIQSDLIASIAEKNAALRRAYRRAKKQDLDASEKAATEDERRRLRHELSSEKSALREAFAQEAAEDEMAGA